MRNLTFLIIFLFAGCAAGAGGPGINWYDGTWAMCKTTDEDGTVLANLPVPLSNLPPGIGITIDGKTVECIPIPVKPVPVPTTPVPE